MSTLASELSLSATRPVAGGQLSELIRSRSSSFGAQAYIEHARDERGLTFGDLEHEVEGWAVTLGDPIAFSVAFLGTIASGRWAAPLDPSTPAPAMGAAIVRVQADIVFSDRSMPTGLDVDWVDLERAAALEWGEGPNPTEVVGVDDMSGGAVLASSGTTGAPKVVYVKGSLLAPIEYKD